MTTAMDANAPNETQRHSSKDDVVRWAFRSSPAPASPQSEEAARQLQEGGAPPPTSHNNADAGGEDAIRKSGIAPEKQADRKAAVIGHTLDEAISIDEASITDAAPAPVMTSPSFLAGRSPQAENPPLRTVPPAAS